MELRPYQSEAKTAVFGQWEQGVLKTLLVLPTGCGKTIVFAKVAEECVRQGKRVLILAHRGELLEQAAYGLAEWCGNKLKEANLIAVPGCYPTAAQLALKPLIDADLLDLNQWPVINATSGVSGAGRKAAISNSFCEVSLQPYGVFNHRHHPEITTHLGADVIFTPHLGSFPRGILETITCRLKPGVTQAQVAQVLQQAYAHKPLVRLYDKGVPALKNVVGLPFCDIGFAVQGEHLIIVATEDNLLKGAAAQAVQCANIRFGYAETQSLI